MYSFWGHCEKVESTDEAISPSFLHPLSWREGILKGRGKGYNNRQSHKGSTMKKNTIPTLVVIAIVVFAVFVVTYNPRREWVEIPGTKGLHYDKDSLKQDGNMVYATLKNENPQAKRSAKATDIQFTAAFYCNRGKIRTLSTTVYYEDGSIESDNENHLEANPNSDELNESHDLQDVSASPELERAFKTFCK
jgi:hypothetical protein